MFARLALVAAFLLGNGSHAARKPAYACLVVPTAAQRAQAIALDATRFKALPHALEPTAPMGADEQKPPAIPERK